MKLIVYISHDRHREDIVKVYKYSEKNLEYVKSKMIERWRDDAKWGWFGDCFSEDGGQYGWNEEYYDSYGIVDLIEEVEV